jgi:hypothetical protein
VPKSLAVFIILLFLFQSLLNVVVLHNIMAEISLSRRAAKPGRADVTWIGDVSFFM